MSLEDRYETTDIIPVASISKTPCGRLATIDTQSPTASQMRIRPMRAIPIGRASHVGAGELVHQ